MTKPKIIQFKLKILSKPALLMLLIGSSATGTLYANSREAANLSLKKVELNVVQQSIAIKGKVVSAEDKMGIPGVNISVKGVKEGVTTDVDGNYSINVKSTDAILVFSSVGFITKEIKVGAQTSINVTLYADVSSLKEVVVVGYGTQKKATLTGAVEQVTSKAFEDRSVTNVVLALQGQTPGLVVSRNSPRPGNEGLAMQIRGATSINGGSPLVVIDGVPALNYQSLQNMNSDDIESVSVLKDGAASIFGAKAANGVILVTTKKGKGKMRVDYNSNFRFTTNGITSFSPNMQQYASMWLAANQEETVPFWWGWVSKENVLQMQKGVAGVYQTQYWGDVFMANANRIDEMFATRYSYQHNLSISNQTEASSYRISLGYADNQGNLATAKDGQKQYNFRLNYDFKLSEKLKLGSSVSLINAVTSTPSAGLDAALFAFDMPFFPAKNPYGQWYANFGRAGNRNSAAATSDGGRDNIGDLTGRIDFKATYQIFKDLAFEGLASFQNERKNEEKYIIPVATYDWFGGPADNAVLDATKQSAGNPGYMTYAGNIWYQYYSALMKYNKTINGLHNISVVSGINAEKTNWQSLTGTRLNFNDLGVYDLNTASNATMTNAGGKDVRGVYSYIAKVNYNYAEKYLLELSGRRDGNSQLAQGYKFRNFGSAQVGWVFTQEKFLHRITPIIDFGKVRLTYGSSGNTAGINSFDYLSTVNTGTIALGQSAANQTTSSLSNNGLTSSTRTWERVEQKNAGIDLRLLKSRLFTSFDYFIKDNVGMLSNVLFPTTLGAVAPKTNSGHFNVKGWEAVIGWKDTKKDFSYNVSFNIGNTKTLVSNVENADNYVAGKNTVLNGYPMNSWFVYKTAGYFKDQAAVDAYYANYGSSTDLAAMPSSNPVANLRPGDVIKVDVAKTGNITSVGNEKSSLVYKGDGNAHYVFGINMGGSFKGFDINMFFQGQLQQLIQRSGFMAYPFAAQYTNLATNYLGKTWTTTNTNAEFPRSSVYPVRANWNYLNNDFNIQNNKYIRLKSLVIGYTIPKSVSQKVGLDKVRVYFSGDDLWELANIKDGFDPEMGETSQNSGYPFARTWSFGFNVGF